MRLIQVGKKPVHENISGVGLFTFPPDKPVEVKNTHLANVLLERLHWTGLTQVPEAEGPDGLPVYDLKSARELAKQKLQEARKGLVERYIQHQLETRVRQNMPPLPPSPAVAEIVEEDGWDLKEYGINPVGWKTGQAKQAQDERITALEQSNATLQETLKELMEQNRLLLEQISGKGKR